MSANGNTAIDLSEIAATAGACPFIGQKRIATPTAMATPMSITADNTTRVETLLDHPPVKITGFAALGPAAPITLEVDVESWLIDSASLLNAPGIPKTAT